MISAGGPQTKKPNNSQTPHMAGGKTTSKCSEYIPKYLSATSHSEAA